MRTVLVTIFVVGGGPFGCRRLGAADWAPPIGRHITGMPPDGGIWCRLGARQPNTTGHLGAVRLGWVRLVLALDSPGAQTAVPKRTRRFVAGTPNFNLTCRFCLWFP